MNTSSIDQRIRSTRHLSFPDLRWIMSSARTSRRGDTGRDGGTLSSGTPRCSRRGHSSALSTSRTNLLLHFLSTQRHLLEFTYLSRSSDTQTTTGSMAKRCRTLSTHYPRRYPFYYTHNWATHLDDAWSTLVVARVREKRFGQSRRFITSGRN